MDILEGYVIAGENLKEEILRESKGFKNYIFLSEGELIKKLYGEAKPEALLYLMEEYDLPIEIAKDYISYMPYLNKDFYNSLKLDSILASKRALIEKGLYTIDPLFKLRLKEYPMTILEFNNLAILDLIVAEIKKYTEVFLINEAYQEYKPKCYSFDDYESECRYIMNSIYNLYNEGISLNNIYILNIDSNYEFILKRLAVEYNLPIKFSDEKNILLFPLPNKFLELCKIKPSFDSIMEELDSEDIYYKEILKIIIKYKLKDKNPIDYIDFLVYLLKNAKCDSDIYECMIRTNTKDYYNDNEYVFYLGCNLGIVPRVYKDEEYLNDSELELINMPTTSIKNRDSKNKIINLFTHTKNLIVSLKRGTGKDEGFPSNIIIELGLNIEAPSVSMGINEIEDKIRLGVAYTKYFKYKEVGSDLALASDIKYNQYDNKFKGVARNKLDIKFNEYKPKLSYSSLTTYFKCPFRYYCERVLGLNEFKSNSGARLGSFSHEVLEDSYSDQFDFEESTAKAALKMADPEEKYMDFFYMNKMKTILRELIEYNHRHEGESDLDICKRELEIGFEEKEFKFVGFIDKLLYTIDNDDVYCAIIDYKTGGDNPTLDNLKYGFNLQLPTYMLLLHKYPEFEGKNIHIIGIYLQWVNIIALDNTKDIVKQREDEFKLRGFTIKSIPLINKLDKDFQDSSYIRSMKCKKNGEFYAGAKLITNEDIDRLIKLTHDLIYDAAGKIREGLYPIAPKRIDLKNLSCKYCEYTDICYKTYNDLIDLENDPFIKKEEK